MIRRVALAAALAFATPASARVVDYAAGEPAMAEAATALKIAPIAPLPDSGDRAMTISVDPAADHITLALGMICSAYKVENPVSRLMAMLTVGIGAPASGGGRSPATLRVTSASSYRRCVEVSEANVRCITRAALAGILTTDGRDMPVSGEAERDASVGGFCGNLARGVGVVSREAGIALIADARRRIAMAP